MSLLTIAIDLPGDLQRDVYPIVVRHRYRVHGRLITPWLSCHIVSAIVAEFMVASQRHGRCVASAIVVELMGAL